LVGLPLAVVFYGIYRFIIGKITNNALMYTSGSSYDSSYSGSSSRSTSKNFNQAEDLDETEGWGNTDVSKFDEWK
jgi:hypothetical protein